MLTNGKTWSIQLYSPCRIMKMSKEVTIGSWYVTRKHKDISSTKIQKQTRIQSRQLGTIPAIATPQLWVEEHCGNHWCPIGPALQVSHSSPWVQETDFLHSNPIEIQSSMASMSFNGYHWGFKPFKIWDASRKTLGSPFTVLNCAHPTLANLRKAHQHLILTSIANINLYITLKGRVNIPIESHFSYTWNHFN